MTGKFQNLSLCWLLPPTMKLGQGYIFTGVCDSVNRGVCLSACWDTPRAGTPPEQTPPQSRHPPEQTPPGTRHPPGTRPPPGPDPALCSACWEIQSTRGWYASYWNAYLFIILLRQKVAVAIVTCEQTLTEFSDLVMLGVYHCFLWHNYNVIFSRRNMTSWRHLI